MMMNRRRLWLLLPVIVSCVALLLLSSTVAGASVDHGGEFDEFTDVKTVSKAKWAVDDDEEFNVHGDDEPPIVTITKKVPVVEGIGILFLIIYGVFFFRGKNQNEDLARAWYEEYIGLFTEQFAAVGLSSDGSTNVDTMGRLIKESQSSYRFFCSGRRKCAGLVAELELKKRQDLLSVLSQCIYPTKDFLNIDISLLDNRVDNFVLCLAKSAAFKHLSTQMKELIIPSKAKSSPLGQLNVYTEFPELLPALLTSLVKKTLLDHETYVESIVFTDLNRVPIDGFSTEGQRHVIRCRLVLPPVAEMGHIKKLLEMILHFVDAAATITLSKNARKRSEANRTAFKAVENDEGAESRVERANRIRVEKHQKEQQDYEGLSYEQQQKRDNIKAKKNARKRQNKRVTKA